MNSQVQLLKVGIIGGAGPMAGTLLVKKIIHICQMHYHCQLDADFPYIMLLSYPFDDMLSGNQKADPHKTISKQLKDCLETFANQRISIVAIACNTLHEFLEQRSYRGITILHMIEEIALHLNEKQIFNPLVLVTSTSAKCKLHNRYFQCLYPQVDLQQAVDLLINKILTGQYNETDSKNLLKGIQKFFFKKNHEGPIKVILGCTELSVLHEQFPLDSQMTKNRFFVIDPLQIIAESICRNIFNPL